MEKTVFVAASELPFEKRRAAEILLGDALDEGDLVLIRSSQGRILSRGLEGEHLQDAYRRLHEWTGEVADRVRNVPQSQIDNVLDEALSHARTSQPR